MREAAFRGRLLRGVAHALPEGYQGVVLSREASGEAWRAAAGFTAFTAWNHDTPPTGADAAPRLLQWLRLADALAAPIAAAEVTRRVAEGAAAAAAAAAPAAADA